MTTAQPGYQALNRAKANFDWAYNRLDPRDYFGALGPLGYEIPDQAAPVLRAAARARSRALSGRRISVLDLGCSYGINAAVMKYGFDMPALGRRYARLGEDGASAMDVLEADRSLFNRLEPKLDVGFVGLDNAQCAAAYAYWSGLVDDAVPEDLEADTPSPHAARAIRACDLIIATGVVGYITERTFMRVLDCRPPGRLPWVAWFALRMFSPEPVIAALERKGLLTETLNGRLFSQRRFKTEAEKAHVLSAVTARGLDPAGYESEGGHYAQFFLSRPPACIAALPLAQLVADA
jgi:SAM-dependent methyltransferase